MKKFILRSVALLFCLSLFAPSAFAANGRCKELYRQGTEGIKKDPKCGKDFANIAAKIGAQLRACRNHRDNLKRCNMAKRHVARACRGQKRTCKRVCRGGKKACKRRCTRGQRNCQKACPRGRRGKNCRRACRRCVKRCNRSKRKCKRVCTKVSRRCLQATRRKAHTCRSEARTKQAFKVCQNARALTAKAGGRLFGCAWKHYNRAVMCSVNDIISSLGKKR